MSFHNAIADVVETKCPFSDQLSCMEIDSSCFFISDICIYRLNKHEQIIPCITGSHMQECEHFECNLHFKCLGYYCIPWGYTCDGKWDCPHGYDELLGHTCVDRVCENMFRCRNSSVCVHTNDVCDGFSDCPLGGDEILCELKSSYCFAGCDCLNLAILCNNITLNYLPFLNSPYISYHITFCLLYEANVMFKNHHILNLNVSHNRIKNICDKNELPESIESLDFSYNLIDNVTNNCFFRQFHSRFISLKNNLLNSLQPLTFNYMNVFSLDL